MDAVFKALSDPTRRQLLDTLRDRGGLTLTELEAGLEPAANGAAAPSSEPLPTAPSNANGATPTDETVVSGARGGSGTA